MQKRILIVEDEFLIALDLKQILESEGYDVVFNVSSFDNAIEILQTTSFDLVLIDIGLKGNKTGLDLARYIQQTSKLPYIFVTSFHDLKTLKDVAEAKSAGYVVKPLKSLDVLSAVQLAFFQTMSNLQASETFGIEPEEIPYRIKKVVQYIDANIQDKIIIDDLAALTEWHKQYFTRIFQRVMNATPYQYILQRKIEKAAEMIISTDIPCAQIGFEFGFMSYTNFNRAFRTLKKVTPEQYRVKYK